MPLLSCEECRSRKVKCDKVADGCSACRSAGLRCHTVQRSRLPRGRSGKTKSKNVELEERVVRIERLLKQAASARGPDPIQCHPSFRTENPPSKQPAGKLTDFVAPIFWTTLADEVAGLRTTLEEGSEDEAPNDPRNRSCYQNDRSNGSRCDFQFPPALSLPRSLGGPQIAPGFESTLCAIYRTRVDSVFKILHWPSALLTVQESAVLDSVGPGQALASAIYFMAVCALSDNECMQVCGYPRLSMLNAYCSATEKVISDARIMQAPSIVGLQAYVIYLNALRASKKHALSWTLLAVAVRLADALGLGREDPSSMSALTLETRRRLWYGMSLLDTQAMLDRGSTALVMSTALGPPPLSIGDEVLTSSANPSAPPTPAPDMLFASMTYKAMVCQKQMSEVVTDSQDGWSGWSRRVALVSDFEQSIQVEYLSSHTLTAPIAILTKVAAEIILANMHLLLRRPPYRRSLTSVPPWDDFDVLQNATTVLERHLQLFEHADPLSPWAWKEWTPWYALAVVLAELCRDVRQPGSENAFVVACRVFRRHAVPADDIESGMLWKPIARLLRRVKREREALKDRSSSSLTESVGSRGPNHKPVDEDHARMTTAAQRAALDRQPKPAIGDASPCTGQEHHEMVDGAFDFLDIDFTTYDYLPGMELDEDVSWLEWTLPS
ncbi:hypothetical protein BAUCODRAFT_122802 [Baudoinia panamericana UAMH 10762]|uniref:Zn(2)-C6 fungal-type domain-containing protein n=1 Tax=Baudoinia panamericana (strain UAMH 10762) TaxID=717646 RepID=M2NCD4_BAUPA|nr:uncharacterized protein BAUCODRAFT_122802 [Baudoinia panamericana UAMH 10762]EMC96844.1 hypothetical protein BAUCODRAFT_122802 [Baudoinia panamericana UAMH 10762]